MRIGICEDEQLFLEFEYNKIEEFFLGHGEQVQIDTFSDGKQLLQKYSGKRSYDLIVLDLQMTHSDGMDIAREIRKSDDTVPILFVTGVENRAAEGYHVDALDYVLKSRLETGLADALLRFWDKHQKSTVAIEIAEGETIILAFDQILWLESEKRGTKIVTADATYYSVQPIGKIASLLPCNHFTEIYKSIFVQLRAIKRIGNDYVEMSNGNTLPLSRRKKKTVMSDVLELVKGKL